MSYESHLVTWMPRDLERIAAEPELARYRLSVAGAAALLSPQLKPSTVSNWALRGIRDSRKERIYLVHRELRAGMRVKAFAVEDVDRFAQALWGRFPGDLFFDALQPAAQIALGVGPYGKRATLDNTSQHMPSKEAP